MRNFTLSYAHLLHTIIIVIVMHINLDGHCGAFEVSLLTLFYNIDVVVKWLLLRKTGVKSVVITNKI